MMSSAMKQIEERHVSHEIHLLVWSDRMDLLALANLKGEVYLHRYNWQRVWYLPPHQQGDTVKGMAWRPDGKVFAVGYSTGDVKLIDIETERVLHTICIKDGVSCIAWINENSIDCNTGRDESETSPRFESNAEQYLPSLPELSWGGNPVNKTLSDSLVDTNCMNILFIGTPTGILHVSVFGLLIIANINISEIIKEDCSVESVHISNNFDVLYVVVRCKGSEDLKIVELDTSVIMKHTPELHAFAFKHGTLISLLKYLEGTIVAVVEAWETILMEMDSKLAKYASTVPKGAVSADFLELLMFGVPSDEMEAFLLQDLTQKGLKKLGHSIELSYSNIQKLVLKHLTKVGQSIMFHLVELRGLARIEHRYAKVGLDVECVTNAISATASFLIKGTEVQQVIDHSMRNYKAFFRWLYVVILRLTGEVLPPEITKMTQQDLTFIAEFLQNFDSLPTETSKVGTYFNLERLGQYLIDSELTIPIETDLNPWNQLLKENPCIADHEVVFKHYNEMSLIQQQNHLSKSIKDIFVKPQKIVQTQFRLKNVLNILNISEDCEVRSSFTNFDNKSVFFACLKGSPPSEGIYFLEFNAGQVKCAFFYFESTENMNDSVLNYFSGSNRRLKVLDIQFYTLNVLSVLLEIDSDSRTCVFGQFPTTPARDLLADIPVSDEGKICNYNIPEINGCSVVINTSLRPIDDLIASKFSVSGSRKVSVILSENLRNVVLFEMEVDEDEEEEEGDVTISTAKESDNSVPENSIDVSTVDTSTTDTNMVE